MQRCLINAGEPIEPGEKSQKRLVSVTKSTGTMVNTPLSVQPIEGYGRIGSDTEPKKTGVDYWGAKEHGQGNVTMWDRLIEELMSAWAYLFWDEDRRPKEEDEEGEEVDD